MLFHRFTEREGLAFRHPGRLGKKRPGAVLQALEIQWLHGARRKHGRHDLGGATVIPGDHRTAQAKRFQHGPAKGLRRVVGQVEDQLRCGHPVTNVQAVAGKGDAFPDAHLVRQRFQFGLVARSGLASTDEHALQVRNVAVQGIDQVQKIDMTLPARYAAR